MQVTDLVHDEHEAKCLIENCPHIEDSLDDCDRFHLDAHLLSEKPWYMPHINIFYLGGFNTLIANRWTLDRIKDFDTLKAFIENVTEQANLKEYLVFKKCPGCGLELPAVDFRLREDGLCTFCGSKIREQSIVTHVSRSQEEE